MDGNRPNWVFEAITYILAAVAGPIGIWWCWKHGWPWPFNSMKVQVDLFMGVPIAVLMAIIWAIRRGRTDA